MKLAILGMGWFLIIVLVLWITKPVQADVPFLTYPTPGACVYITGYAGGSVAIAAIPKPREGC